MEKQINIDGLNINYTESGDSQKPPVLILHGWGCNCTTVKSIASCIDDSFHVFCLDLPGHGKSDEPQEVWSTHDFANLVKKFAGTLSLTSPILIGHSFGGRTSIAFASENPVAKMVLVDSAGITPKRSLKYYYKVYSYKTLKKLALGLLGEKKSREMLEKIVKKKGSADYQAASPKMRAVMSKCVNEDLRKLLPKIAAPTLLIWGENDTATPLSDAQLMEKLIPDAGLVKFAQCGHYSFLDNPFAFKTVLRQFLT